MAKGGGSTTQTQGLDQGTQQYVDQVRKAAQDAAGGAGPGLSSETQGAIDQYGQFMKGGNLGFSALTGDPSSMAQFMNPYQQQVIDRVNSQYGDIRKQTMGAVDDSATAAGAFGGSRHDVATGMALGQVGKSQADQIAQLLYGGYNDAAGRAGQAANLGFGATGAMSDLGQYTRGVGMDQNPAMWRLKMLQMGMNTPYGQTSTTTQRSGSNPYSGALGGAAAGSAFGPWGAAAGGLLGLFS
jgi:hypothetical protein